MPLSRLYFFDEVIWVKTYNVLDTQNHFNFILCYEWIKYNLLKLRTILSSQTEENYLNKRNKNYIAIPTGEWFEY